jgi:hypothetical protein
MYGRNILKIKETLICVPFIFIENKVKKFIKNRDVKNEEVQSFVSTNALTSISSNTKLFPDQLHSQFWLLAIHSKSFLRKMSILHLQS